LLQRRRWQPLPAAQRDEIQLAQRVRAARRVGHSAHDEVAPLQHRDPCQYSLHLDRGHEPLLEAHRHDGPRLPI